MNVSELYDLTHWLDEETKGTNFRALQGMLQQETPPIDERLSEEAQNGVSLEALTKDQLTTFSEHFGIAKIVNEEEAWFYAV